jgi:hypothetical protein
MNPLTEVVRLCSELQSFTFCRLSPLTDEQFDDEIYTIMKKRKQNVDLKIFVGSKIYYCLTIVSNKGKRTLCV